MNIFKRKRDKVAENEFQHLERRLESSLLPVTPRPEFVQDLRGRLMNHVSLSDQTSTIPDEIPRGWLVAGGVVGSILMLLINLRGLLSLVGVFGLLYKYLSDDKNRPASQPAQ